MAKSLLNYYDRDKRYTSSVPALGLGRGHDDISCFSDEEEEEEGYINALNDETFGGDILEDWEDNHEKLTSLNKGKAEDNGEEKRNVRFMDDDDWGPARHIEDSINALVLDDEPFEDPAISYISRSQPVGVPKTRSLWRHSPVPQLHADAAGSPQLSSIWSTSPNDSAYYASKSLPNSIRDALPSTASLPKNLPNARTLEDIERDMLQSSPTSNKSSVPTTPAKLPQFVRPPPAFPPLPSPILPIGNGFGRGRGLPLTGPLSSSQPQKTSFSSSPQKSVFLSSPLKGFSPLKDGNQPINGIIRQPQDFLKREFGRRQSGSEDEYAGLMTMQEKNWLISIQLNQLHTDNPYIDDYYYMAFMMNKLSQKSGGRETPLPIREPDRYKQLESRKYIPPQMENSLGRVQVVSVQAPRKMIDIKVVAAPTKPREISKHKQLLMEVEHGYTTLLEIDDCCKRLAMGTEGPELQAIEDESRKMLLKLHYQMLDEDKLVQFLQVRKGKKLLVRLEPFLDTLDRQRVVKSLLKGFAVINKKDTDNMLPDFAHLCEKAISTATLPQLVDMVKNLSKTNFVSALGHKIGVYVILLLLHHAESKQTEDGLSEWNEFIKSVCDATTSCPSIASSCTNIEKLTLEESIRRHPKYVPQLTKLKNSTL